MYSVLGLPLPACSRTSPSIIVFSRLSCLRTSLVIHHKIFRTECFSIAIARSLPITILLRSSPPHRAVHIKHFSEAEIYTWIKTRFDLCLYLGEKRPTRTPGNARAHRFDELVWAPIDFASTKPLNSSNLTLKLMTLSNELLTNTKILQFQQLKTSPHCSATMDTCCVRSTEDSFRFVWP